MTPSRRAPTVRALLAALTLLGLAGATATARINATAAAQTSTDAATAGQAPAPTCSWLARSDDDTVNVAYPDTNATYWALAYTATPGTKLVIRGTYPKARYFSFHTYDPSSVAIDSIYDAQIRPDKHSDNPFRAAPAKHTGRDYTVTVAFTAKPKHPAPNTVYAGAMPIGGSSPNPAGIILYRVYVPDHGQPAAGGPLPAVTTETTGGQVLTSLSDCETPQPSTNGAVNRVYDAGPAAGASTSTNGTKPTWGRVASSPYVGFFGNQQNAYLSAGIQSSDGPIVVVHGKAPSFPNTVEGQPVWKHHQVRYWSICENETSTRVIACAADYQVPLRHGRYTIVISPASARPKNANARHGVAWIRWGPQPKGLLLFRNMVASPSFTHAAQDVKPKTDPSTVMGAYFPHIAYCTTARFQATGWKGCR